MSKEKYEGLSYIATKMRKMAKEVPPFLLVCEQDNTKSIKLGEHNLKNLFLDVASLIEERILSYTEE